MLCFPSSSLFLYRPLSEWRSSFEVIPHSPRTPDVGASIVWPLLEWPFRLSLINTIIVPMAVFHAASRRSICKPLHSSNIMRKVKDTIIPKIPLGHPPSALQNAHSTPQPPQQYHPDNQTPSHHDVHTVISTLVLVHCSDSIIRQSRSYRVLRDHRA
jgi:hypothetical protein